MSGQGRTGRVVISAGHKNFHLLFTAAEIAKRGRLALLMAGATPSPLELWLLTRFPLSKSRKLRRFLNRQEEVPAGLIRQSRLSEMMSSLGLLSQRFGWSGAASRFQCYAMRAYGLRASQVLRSTPAATGGVYHFRAGFGQSSVAVAKSLGMQTLCDHSIVHPSLLATLVHNKGQFPEHSPPHPSGFWRLVLKDIEAADKVIVNSDFVAETFEYMGFPAERVSVVYQGVENKFLSRLPDTRAYRGTNNNIPLKMLFAGGITDRKGVMLLQDALRRVPDLPIELTFAGILSPESKLKLNDLFSDTRVKYVGMLDQQKLANLMSTTDVFVFPTLAEGSARVVFEAMAAGCAIITTPNAGSVVENGKGGILIEPGNASDLTRAIVNFAKPNAPIAEMGRYNHNLIRSRYTQTSYGDQLEKVYDL